MSLDFSGRLLSSFSASTPPSDRQTDRQTDRFVPESLQHQLAQDLDKLKAAIVLEDARSGQDAARIHSLQGKGAGAWRESVPTSGSFTMDKNEFRLGHTEKQVGFG